jgi:predicted esterase
MATTFDPNAAKSLGMFGNTVAWFTRNNQQGAISTARLVHQMSDIASAAYRVRTLADAEGWRTVSDVIPFDGELFNGFVRTDSEKTVVAIRGTHYDKDDPNGLWNVVKQWLRNFDSRQVDMHDCAIHGGYHKELETMYPRIVELLKQHHGSKGRPLYITGHSAGAGLATLIGYKLAKEHGSNLRPTSVVAFASPKVGNEKFSQTYPVKLLRIERGTDLVPVLPLGADATKVMQTVGVDATLRPLTRSLLGAFGLEPDRADNLLTSNYAHAGTMLYYSGDSDPALISARSTMEAPFVYLGQRLSESYGLSRDLPIQYQPQMVVRFNRLKEIVTGVWGQLKAFSGEQARSGLSFVTDHGVDLTAQYLSNLAKRFAK